MARGPVPGANTMTFLQDRRELLSGIVPAYTGPEASTLQLGELQKQIPSLYALLGVNAAALAFTHYAYAPGWMTVGLPGFMIAVCAVRGVHWWRLSLKGVTEAEAMAVLRRTSILTILFSIVFVAWAIGLTAYGGPFEHGHVAIFVAITIVACIFCLTHLPVAALLGTFIVIGAFLVHCFTSGNSVFIAIALNTAFVTVVMVRILINNFLAFLLLIASKAEAQRLVEENRSLAHTDSLTGLPNRRCFFKHLDALIAASAGDQASFALAIFDLDRFKPINDTFGHTAGDRVLAETGRRLAALAADGAIIARLGGDEFGVLFPATAMADVVERCDRICLALHAPISLGEMQVSPGCSGGLAVYPSAGRDADALFDRADYALYHSKERKRGTTTLFSQEHEDAIRAERAVETALQSADLAAEMEMHYQPILDTTTATVTTVEALARWTSPRLGRVPPDRFIAVAERCGMIHALTLLLLGKALADAARLPAGIGLSFNLSSHDLASPETVVAVLAAVRQSGLDPKRITLELTETALMRDFEGAHQAITLLRALGIKIALDDFGTGYSSLNYVHRLPLDRIKIDRGFMADVESDLGRSVVSTILDLCQNLGLDGIAEGIETVEQLNAVRRHGCRYVQGYLIGRPTPIADLLERLPTMTLPPERISA